MVAVGVRLPENVVAFSDEGDELVLFVRGEVDECVLRELREKKTVKVIKLRGDIVALGGSGE